MTYDEAREVLDQNPEASINMNCGFLCVPVSRYVLTQQLEELRSIHGRAREDLGFSLRYCPDTDVIDVVNPEGW